MLRIQTCDNKKDRTRVLQIKWIPLKKIEQSMCQKHEGFLTGTVKQIISSCNNKILYKVKFIFSCLWKSL